MKCTFSELKSLEVINVTDGTRIGYIDDAEIDGDTGRITALIICGRPRLMGLMGHEEDIVISCSDIKKIGTDTVLVNVSDGYESRRCAVSGTGDDLSEYNDTRGKNL